MTLRKTIGLMIGLAALSATSANAAKAEWSSPSDTASPTTHTVMIVDAETSGAYVRFTNPVFGSFGCANPQQYYILSGTPETVSKMLSLLTAAKLSGTPVKVFRTGACSNGYSVITGVMLG